MGLAVLPPDVNESRREWTGRARAVRVGLMQVRGLKQAAVEAVLAAREEAGPYRSLEEFLARVDPDPSDARLLIKAGALDRVGDPPRTRPEMMWRLQLAHSARGGGGGRGRRRARDAQLSLFPQMSPDVLPAAVPAYSEEQMLAQEVETLTFLASRHPLTLWEKALAGVKRVPACELARHAGRRVTVLGWWVTGKVVQTKKGEPMEFVSFEDTTAIYETTFFPEPYARFCRMLSHARPYLLTGKVEEDFGTVSLTVEEVRAVRSSRP